MPEYTVNINLEKPTQNENFRRHVLNENMDKIDNKFGIGAAEGHRHDGTPGQGKKISYYDLADKPDMATPAAHKSTHAIGGSDLITPADIGAVAQTEVVAVPQANKILKLDSSGRLPASISGDADTVDGIQGNMLLQKHATANTDSYFDTSGTMPTGTARLNYSGYFYATKVYGAVYNDYAEFRQSRGEIKPGKVVVECGNGYVAEAKKRCVKGGMIVSDTFGFAIGEQEIEGEYSLPVAVAGRVLAYTDGCEFKIGDAVCAGKDGTVSRMKWWERVLFPDRILGVVSEMPGYCTWGTNQTLVENRIWIKVF
ncbi:MAG: hypothetical protein N3I35_18275 [Clostridia bacterium]|nr:hypothetical protein [Clostridia bacterium]